MALEVPSLSRLTRGEKPQGYTDAEWTRFMALDQEKCRSIEGAFAAIIEQIGLNTEFRLTADAVSLANSYVDPTSVLSAADTGTVTIATHDRVYGNEERVSVVGGTVTGFTDGDYVTVYYSDEDREGGTVTFQGSTDPIAQDGAIHVVGSVTIPASGDPDTGGTSPSAPGYTPPSGGGGNYKIP